MTYVSDDGGGNNQSVIIGISVCFAVLIIIAIIIIVVLLLYKKRFAQYVFYITFIKNCFISSLSVESYCSKYVVILSMLRFNYCLTEQLYIMQCHGRPTSNPIITHNNAHTERSSFH